ncbi:UNVERIFIED_CONTAM: hypothetical protein Sindi_0542200 [Sesamum indicum]
MVIPSSSNPKRLIDVYLEPLIEELQNWYVDVWARDSAKNETFPMRFALMWTVNDLPTYGMTFEWSFANVMGCPVCMEAKRAFYLQNEKKVARSRLTGEQIREWVEEFSITAEVPLSLTEGYSTEYKWIEKSILWELEYWSTNLIRHNLDVMHIEKNVFDNIFNIKMDVKGKTKETLNARKDLKIICNQPKVDVDERRPNVMPKAVYTLTKEQKRRCVNGLVI